MFVLWLRSDGCFVSPVWQAQHPFYVRMTWDGHGFLLCVIHWRGFWYSHGSPCGPQNLRAFTKTAQINSLSLSFRKVCVLLSVYTWPRLLITYVRILETWRFLLLFPPCKIIFASYSSLGCISPFFQVCFPEKLSPTMLLLHCLQFFIKALCSFSMKHLSKLVICIFLCAVFFFFRVNCQISIIHCFISGT